MNHLCDIQSSIDIVYGQAISSNNFEVYVKIAAMHVKQNQLQQLPNRVLQKRQNHSTGVRLTCLSDSSLYLSMASGNCMPVLLTN